MQKRAKGIACGCMRSSARCKFYVKNGQRLRMRCNEKNRTNPRFI
ncbi:hypothetical protein HMPREF1325_0546 [Treponema socranskii subsp. socranskii VPI DR56BR1116 = ATCC 35536]|uniref:Uncharacterized protein n=1 Tax=Treponema socranskii subsp. socranskii VPI DR56BR1116 = ATCC 35536 TaxID=1125725 RepID=U1GTL5_TRESO|nr:hypothetical protein HMPREF1325_0546 [Treponema socranskii subsp. socranskii VPI DR56BR1116 = ATCC 35536]